jgi:WXG100 family type VII secretion target
VILSIGDASAISRQTRNVDPHRQAAVVRETVSALRDQMGTRRAVSPVLSPVLVAGTSQLAVIRERKPTMPNLNVTYADMQSAATQLQNGEQTIQSDLQRLKSLVDNLVASGYVTDSSSKQFESSYTQFNSGATQMIDGLNGMGQYLTAAANAFQETDTQLASALK